MWEIEGGEKSVEIPRNFVPSITFGDQLRSNQSSTMINPADNLQSTSEGPSQQLLPSQSICPRPKDPRDEIARGLSPFQPEAVALEAAESLTLKSSIK